MQLLTSRPIFIAMQIYSRLQDEQEKLVRTCLPVRLQTKSIGSSSPRLWYPCLCLQSLLQEWSQKFTPDAQGVVTVHGFKESVRTAGHYRITVSPEDTDGWMPEPVSTHGVIVRIQHGWPLRFSLLLTDSWKLFLA
jgi:hypothetical protein